MNILLLFLTGVLTSFYLFPIEFIFAPGINTKMVMAAFGIFIFVIETAKKGYLNLNSGFSQILAIGFVVSLIGFIAVVVNNTFDYSYATYFISMFVWLGGAFTLVTIIKYVHGYISIQLICDYLIAVCVAQCFSALLMEYIPTFSDFINRFVLGVGFEKDFKDLQGDRMYGIGAVLDVAGQRFSCILFMIAYLMTNESNSKYRIIWYVISFFIISIIGNMIARTTIVGDFISIIYLLIFFIHRKVEYSNEIKTKVFKILALALIIGIAIVIYLYNTNAVFYNKLRFGFEGFFSLVEKGYWETTSNNTLEKMYRWPNNLHTWLIGDGYFNNPKDDIYYIGRMWKGFYMGTDVGYLRFIYYFGIFGLIAFSLYFLRIGFYLSSTFHKYKVLFWGIVLINFIVWFKVSSDIFSILALFMIFSKDEDRAMISKA